MPQSGSRTRGAEEAEAQGAEEAEAPRGRANLPLPLRRLRSERVRKLPMQ